MKILMISFLTTLSLFTSGCFNPVDIKSASASVIEALSTEDESLITIPGIILSKNVQGKDGSSWNFKGDNEVLYSLVVSIPNLGKVESKNIKYVMPGAKLIITGEAYKLGSEYNFIARKIIKRK